MPHAAPLPDAQPAPAGDAPALARCLNCGTDLHGPYCHVCGQEGVDRNVSLGRLLSDLIGDLFAFDGRFFRTLKPLLTRPGALTLAYNDGHRAPYVPPVRMYIFSSFLLFLVIAALRFDASALLASEAAADGTAVTDSTAVADDTTAGNTAADTRRMTASERAEMQAELDSLRQVLLGDRAVSGSDSMVVVIGGRDASASRLGQLLKDRARRIGEDPRGYQTHLMSRIPLLLFLLVPVFAAELKLLYLRRDRLYVQHLVFALHLHAFVFLATALLLVLERMWPPLGIGYVALPVYLLMAMRGAYGQSWLKTSVKAFVLVGLHLWIATFAVVAYLLLLTLLF